MLKRAIKTLWIVLEEMDLMWIPVERSWRLNERHYGALQGLSKAETADRFGAEQVRLWRRRYDVRPPALTSDDKRYPGNDPRYIRVQAEDIPLAESLKDTIERFLPYWHEVIAPAVRQGQRVLIVAHGNSLRGLLKFLDDVPDKEIAGINIPNGVPLVYELRDDLKPLRRYYLGDQERVERAIKTVSDQLDGRRATRR